MIFIEAQSEEELFRKALETTKTRYITFCDSKILYQITHSNMCLRDL